MHRSSRFQSHLLALTNLLHNPIRNQFCKIKIKKNSLSHVRPLLYLHHCSVSYPSLLENKQLHNSFFVRKTQNYRRWWWWWLKYTAKAGSEITTSRVEKGVWDKLDLILQVCLPPSPLHRQSWGLLDCHFVWTCRPEFARCQTAISSQWQLLVWNGGLATFLPSLVWTKLQCGESRMPATSSEPVPGVKVVLFNELKRKGRPMHTHLLRDKSTEVMVRWLS